MDYKRTAFTCDFMVINGFRWEVQNLALCADPRRRAVLIVRVWLAPSAVPSERRRFALLLLWQIEYGEQVTLLCIAVVAIDHIHDVNFPLVPFSTNHANYANCGVLAVTS